MTSPAPRIVGIDPSLTSTGVAVIDPTTGIQLHRIRSKGSKAATLAERSQRLTGLADAVLRHCDGADLVVIESPAYSNSLGSMHDRSGLWWLIVSDLLTRKVLEVPPTTRAKYATGHGNAGKDEVLAATIRRHPHLEITGNDIADALTLAAIGARLTGWPLEPTIPKTAHAALAKLRLPAGTQGPGTPGTSDTTGDTP